MKHFIKPGQLPSIIHVPPSKSYANRALILAALKPGTVTLKNMPLATDVIFLTRALNQIGLEIEALDDEISVTNYFPACETSGCEIEIGEGGTSARFLASLLVMGAQAYTLILGPRLKHRPWGEFIELVNHLGGSARLEDNKLFLKGPISLPKKLEVDCAKTTQYASGLQLASAFANIEVVPVNMNSSMSYWRMTSALIDYFKQNFVFEIPLDWSSASYAMAFAALKQDTFFPGLKYDPYQADAKLFDLLKSIHALIETPEGIKVKKTPVKRDFQIDVYDCLDLVPTLAFYLSHVEGTHRLKGVENLIHKESDRLKEVMKLMDEFGLKSYYENAELVIEGSHTVSGSYVELNLPDDHRMVMAGSLFLRYHQGGTVTPAEAVEKSYPDFFSLIK